MNAGTRPAASPNNKQLARDWDQAFTVACREAKIRHVSGTGYIADDRDRVPLLEAVWPYAPFRVSSDIVPHVLAAAATRSQTPEVAYTEVAERKVG